MSADDTRAFAPHHASNEFAQILGAYRQDYVRCLPERIDVLDTLWASLAGRELDLDVLEEAELHAHTIAGSAGTFGLAELGYKARVLEYLLQELSTIEGPARAEYDRRVGAAIGSIRLAVNRECSRVAEAA
jgi:chemotaxis protein histidine kinase CheA